MINLLSANGKALDNMYTKTSITDAHCGNNYSWEGVNSVKVLSLLTDELQQYTASGESRFGTTSDVQDELAVYALAEAPSFTKRFDGTHVEDQEFKKKASAYLEQVWKERFVPYIDKKRLQKWADGAGLGTVNATALTKATVIEAMLRAVAALNDAGVPSEGRVFYVASEIGVAIQLAQELGYNQAATSAQIVNGQITKVGGVPVVDGGSRMPAGVEFILKYKNATADPMKTKMLRADDQVPGLYGTLMEGLVRFDSFVLANKADGIFVYSTNGAAAPTFSKSGSTVTIATATSGATIKYTKDGSNPKTSSTAVTGTSVTVAAGDKIRAYAYKDGIVASAIAAYNA